MKATWTLTTLLHPNLCPSQFLQLKQDSAALKEKTRSISKKTPVSPSLLGGKLIPAFAVTPSFVAHLTGCTSKPRMRLSRIQRLASPTVDICVTHRVEVRIFTESINSGCSASFVDAFGAVTQLGTVLCKCKCKIRSLESILDLCIAALCLGCVRGSLGPVGLYHSAPNLQ